MCEVFINLFGVVLVTGVIFHGTRAVRRDVHRR
jgi:hypothetical protein